MCNEISDKAVNSGPVFVVAVVVVVADRVFDKTNNYFRYARKPCVGRINATRSHYPK